MSIANLRCRAWAVAAAMLAGCATAPPPNSAPPLLPPAVDRGAHKLPSYVYVGECCRFASSGGNITLYDLALTGVARTITKGVTTPNFITVDRSGRMYAINRFYFYGVVTEYDRGSLSPSRSIKLDGPWAAATDSSNNLYVASCPTCIEYHSHSGNSSVDVYEAGTTKLLRTITNGVDSPLSLAFDSTGNLYVADDAYPHPAVTVYAPGSSKPLRKLTKGLTGPTEIAFDRSNNLFVMNVPGNGTQRIVEYEAASDKVLRKITSGVSSPQAIAVDSSGTLYVANSPGGHGWISVYASGASTPEYQISRGVDVPNALTVDAEENLYVANSGDESPSRDRGTVCVYAPNTRKPLRCVRGRRKFDWATWLATGP